MSPILEVKWNGKQFPIEFRNEKELERSTVKDVKSICQRITGVDPKYIKLYAFGALMNVEDLPLNVYGLRPGCFVTMKVSHKTKESSGKDEPQKQQEYQSKKHNHPHQHKNVSSNHQMKGSQQNMEKAEISVEESQLLEKLQQIRTKIDSDITPQVKKYERDVKEFVVNPQPTEKEKKKLFYTGAYLGEQLMHIFFDLDAFTCGSTNLKARYARKQTVILTQSLMDKVDEVKSVVKSVEVEQEEDES